jgi:hypothetical protein
MDVTQFWTIAGMWSPTARLEERQGNRHFIHKCPHLQFASHDYSRFALIAGPNMVDFLKYNFLHYKNDIFEAGKSTYMRQVCAYNSIESSANTFHAGLFAANPRPNGFHGAGRLCLLLPR